MVCSNPAVKKGSYVLDLISSWDVSGEGRLLAQEVKVLDAEQKWLKIRHKIVILFQIEQRKENPGRR